MELLQSVSTMAMVCAIGRTGDASIIPEAGEGDIDIFVYGDEIPGYEARKAVYDKNSALYQQCKMQVCEGGVWGTGDVFIINGVDTMLMYFRTDETLAYLEKILAGKYLDSIDDFYPIGRCATLKNISVLYDATGFLASIKERLMVYPDQLASKMVSHHLVGSMTTRILSGLVTRKDVLFYHHVLEASMDHYLQALFAAQDLFPQQEKDPTVHRFLCNQARALL